jgi:hypothetical protein
VEIIVHGTGDIDRLYSSPHGIFIRRDGGVQALNVTDVQEWSIQVTSVTHHNHSLLIEYNHTGRLGIRKCYSRHNNLVC